MSQDAQEQQGRLALIAACYCSKTVWSGVGKVITACIRLLCGVPNGRRLNLTAFSFCETHAARAQIVQQDHLWSECFRCDT
jgi:hypothetical protein